MKKFNALFIVLITMLFLSATTWAASPSTLKPNVWNAEQTFNHGVVINTAGDITSSNIADVTRSIPLQLHAAVIDTAGTITLMGNDGTTAPGVAAADGVPAIIWASSAEMASVGWTFQIPADYSTGLSFRLLVSSSSSTSYEALGLHWGLYVNNPDTIFDAASYGQTIVLNTNPNPATSNDYMIFTANATALADIAAGDTVTVYFGGGDGRAGAAKTTEIKSVEARYTAVQ